MSYALKGLKILDFSTLLPVHLLHYILQTWVQKLCILNHPRPDLVRLMPPFAWTGHNA